MSVRDDGGPAFPREDYQLANNLGQCGMSLRDYFAGQYLAGRAARERGIDDWEEAATVAYQIASEMLKAREEVA